MSKFLITSEKSGLILALGAITVGPAYSERITYGVMAERGEAVRALLQKYSVYKKDARINELIDNTNKLSAYWDQRKLQDIDNQWLWDAISIGRVADAVLPLDGHADAQRLLIKAIDGEVSMARRDSSKAKDQLWELEVWSRLNRQGLKSDLAEPDVVCRGNSGDMGIACKKVYSEGHIQNVLSEAVAQIEGTTLYGLAAFNLDDLLPDTLFVAPTVEAVGEA